MRAKPCHLLDYLQQLQPLLSPYQF